MKICYYIKIVVCNYVKSVVDEFNQTIQHLKNIYILGTVAEGAPVIPISAQLKYNIEVICEYAVKKIPVPLRDFTSEPRLIGIYIFVVFNRILLLTFICKM